MKYMVKMSLYEKQNNKKIPWIMNPCVGFKERENTVIERHGDMLKLMFQIECRSLVYYYNSRVSSPVLPGIR